MDTALVTWAQQQELGLSSSKWVQAYMASAAEIGRQQLSKWVQA